MPHFKIVLIIFKPFLDNEMFIFEEYGVFNLGPAESGYNQPLQTGSIQIIGFFRSTLFVIK